MNTCPDFIIFLFLCFVSVLCFLSPTCLPSPPRFSLPPPSVFVILTSLCHVSSVFPLAVSGHRHGDNTHLWWRMQQLRLLRPAVFSPLRSPSLSLKGAATRTWFGVPFAGWDEWAGLQWKLRWISLMNGQIVDITHRAVTKVSSEEPNTAVMYELCDGEAILKEFLYCYWI